MTDHLQAKRPPGGRRGSVRYLPNLPLPGTIADGQVGIADMADAFGVTHRTLHFYEEKGLLSAERMGPMRVYGNEDIRRMAVINGCREIDMPIADIQQLMADLLEADSQDEADRLFAEALLAHRKELVALQSTLCRQIQRVTELLESAAHDEHKPILLRERVHLSPIETRCIQMMAKGAAASRIALDMHMDVAAVATLEADIIRKFNGHNRFQAIAKAMLHGHVSAE
ncbi:MerR family transcriptional regulator [Ensifer soli]|uniref:MerR family transcriptional regulator n=1 Tax=Ciceribacter sp. sgz301302 TaxID=3342379 RepID=UPI0035B76739